MSHLLLYFANNNTKQFIQKYFINEFSLRIVASFFFFLSPCSPLAVKRTHFDVGERQLRTITAVVFSSQKREECTHSYQQGLENW